MDCSNLVAILNTSQGNFTVHPIESCPAPYHYVASSWSAGNFPTKALALELAWLNGYEVINPCDDFSIDRPVQIGPVRVFTNMSR